MPDPAPQLSFGATSVAELVTAVRQVVDPAPSVNWEQLATDVATHVEQLVQANSQLVRDVPSEQWLRHAVSRWPPIELCIRIWKGGVSWRPFATPWKRRSERGYRGYLESRFGISDDAPHQAFSRISENFQKRGEERFGSTLRYATDIRDGRRNFVNIERCFFNDFFRANQAPEVTSLFCALDKVWAVKPLKDSAMTFDSNVQQRSPMAMMHVASSFRNGIRPSLSVNPQSALSKDSTWHSALHKPIAEAAIAVQSDSRSRRIFPS